MCSVSGTLVLHIKWQNTLFRKTHRSVAWSDALIGSLQSGFNISKSSQLYITLETQSAIALRSDIGLILAAEDRKQLMFLNLRKWRLLIPVTFGETVKMRRLRQTFMIYSILSCSHSTWQPPKMRSHVSTDQYNTVGVAASRIHKILTSVVACAVLL